MGSCPVSSESSAFMIKADPQILPFEDRRTGKFGNIDTLADVADMVRYNGPIVMAEERGEVTALLDELRRGQPDAESRLLSLVYLRLKRLAQVYLRKERSGHTLHATDLVHEVYLRMTGARTDWQDRVHFFRVASRAMRRILVDYARAHHAQKRADGWNRVAFDDAVFVPAGGFEQVIEIDEALQKLSLIDPRQARIAELRYFADLSVEETAEALGCSDRTIKREWRIARAWLRRELSRRERP